MGTVRARMGRQVDLDDLIDSAGVAEMIDVSHRNTVRTYRSRYPDFPQPVVTHSGNRCLLWLRPDIEKWIRSRAERQR